MDEQIDDTERRRRRARYVIAAPPSGAPIWIEGEPSWHGTLVLAVWCVAVPLALLAGALWLLFGR